MVEILLLVLIVAVFAVARQLKRVAHILRHFKVEAVIPVYQTDDDPEPTRSYWRTEAPTLPDNIVRGSFDRRRVNR